MITLESALGKTYSLPLIQFDSFGCLNNQHHRKTLLKFVHNRLPNLRYFVSLIQLDRLSEKIKPMEKYCFSLDSSIKTQSVLVEPLSAIKIITLSFIFNYPRSTYTEYIFQSKIILVI